VHARFLHSNLRHPWMPRLPVWGGRSCGAELRRGHRGDATEQSWSH